MPIIYETRSAGAVHHVPFRALDDTQYHAWTRRLSELGIPNGGEVGHFYFHSVYFRETNGILFEIAPGCAAVLHHEAVGGVFRAAECCA